MSKKFKIVAMIFTITLLLFVIYYFFYINKSNKNEYIDNIPNITFDINNYIVNDVEGYLGEVDIFNVEMKSVSTNDNKIHLKFSDDTIYKVEYDLYNMTKEKVYSSTADNIIIIDPSLEKNKEYILHIKINIKNNIVNYLVRVYNGNTLLEEHTKFAEKLSSTMIEKKDMTAYAKFFNNLNNKDYRQDYVDINSNLSDLQYLDINISSVDKKSVEIVNINNFMTGIVIRSIVNDEKDNISYEVREYFRIRNSGVELYLLNYNRDIEKKYSNEVLSTGINIGKSFNKTTIVNKDNTIAFTRAGQLYLFNIKDAKFTTIYGSSSEKGIFLSNRDYEIKILSIDDNKNVVYAILGKIPYGNNKYRYGVEFRRYIYSNNVDKELIFININQGSNIIKSHVYDFIYFNDNGNLGFMLDNLLVNVDNKQNVSYINYKDKKNVVYSGYTKEIAYVEDNNIQIYNAEYGNIRTVKNLSQEYNIVPKGFLNSGDLVYSFENKNTLEIEKIVIINRLNDVIKEYVNNNKITNIEIYQNAIKLDIEDRLTHKKLPDDYVVNTLNSNSYNENIYDSNIQSYINIKFDTPVDINNINFIAPIVNNSEVKTVYTKVDFNLYSIYNKGTIQKYGSNIVDAISTAKKYYSSVRDSNGYLVWQLQLARDNKMISNINPISSTNISSNEACINAIMKYYKKNGVYDKNISYDENIKLLFANNYKFENLEMNDLLYFVQNGIPVITTIDDIYVVVLGTIDNYVVVMNPQKTELEYYSPNEFDEETLFSGYAIRD